MPGSAKNLGASRHAWNWNRIHVYNKSCNFNIFKCLLSTFGSTWIVLAKIGGKIVAGRVVVKPIVFTPSMHVRVTAKFASPAVSFGADRL